MRLSSGLKSNLLVIIILMFATMLSACSSLKTELSVGDIAPDFSLDAADGSLVSLQDYAGKPVLLYFHMALG
jgi:cytochrome oxidase Cu insertion factor (SCO1/SenC/PrrC family)